MAEAAAADKGWQNYKSPAAKQAQQGQDLTNPGLPALNGDDEYVFQLERVTLKQNVENAYNKGETQDRFYTLWKEEKTGNVVMIAFRVDKLVYNSHSPKFQTPVLTFFQKLGIPIPEGTEPNWGNLFIHGMRIRARVNPRMENGKPIGSYNLEIATVRRYLRDEDKK